MEVSEFRAKLLGVRTSHAQTITRISRYIKGALIVGGAFVAGVAQFATWPSGGSPDAVQVMGIAATIGVFVGGLMVLFTEQDAAAAIELAQRAIERVQEAESQIEDFEQFFDVFDRAVETYQMCLTLRGALEQSGLGPVGDEAGFIKSLFDLSIRAVTIAAGFDQADRWTVGIYRASPAAEPGRADLKCIVHDRAIKCGIDEARVWPEGVGIAGIAYTNSREIVIPNLRAEGVQAVFGPRGLVRPYDTERYVSMVAVPIMVAGRAKPWGVVSATSDRVGHFSAESRPGFKTDEPIRALSAFIALAIAMRDAQDKARAAASVVASTTTLVTSGSTASP